MVTTTVATPAQVHAALQSGGLPGLQLFITQAEAEEEAAETEVANKRALLKAARAKEREKAAEASKANDAFAGAPTHAHKALLDTATAKQGVLQDNITALETSCKACQYKLAATLAELEALRRERDELKATAAEHAQGKADAQEDAQTLAGSLSVALAQSDVCVARLATRQRELEEAKRELAQTIGGDIVFKTLIRELRQEVRTGKQHKAVSCALVASLREQLDAAETRAEAQSASEAGALVKVQVVTALMETKEQDKTAQEEDVKRLESELEQARAACNTMRAKVTRLAGASAAAAAADAELADAAASIADK